MRSASSPSLRRVDTDQQGALLSLLCRAVNLYDQRVGRSANAQCTGWAREWVGRDRIAEGKTSFRDKAGLRAGSRCFPACRSDGWRIPCGCRRRDYHAAEDAPPLVVVHTELEAAAPHSMTSSARERIDGGTVRPSAFAVFRLMTKSKCVGPSIGNSPAEAPRKIRATSSAACLRNSVKFGP